MKKKKNKKNKPARTMSEAERAAWKLIALRHHFHEQPHEKTPAQIKADEYAKKHPQPQKPKVVSTSRPFIRVIYTPMGGLNRRY